jgi:hypothetical protein
MAPLIQGLRLHHVGWVVPDLESATDAFQNLGYVVENALPDALDSNFNVKLRFLRHSVETTLVELVQPANSGSKVSGLLERCGAGPYHLAYCVDDIKMAATALRAIEFRPATTSLRAPALGMREIQFFRRKDVGLIELIQWPTINPQV